MSRFDATTSVVMFIWDETRWICGVEMRNMARGSIVISNETSLIPGERRNCSRTSAELEYRGIRGDGVATLQTPICLECGRQFFTLFFGT